MLPRTPPSFERRASAPSVAVADMPDAMEAGVKLKMPVGLLGHATRAQKNLETLRQTGSPEGIVIAAIQKYDEEVTKLREACEDVRPVDEIQAAAKEAWIERNVEPKERFLIAMKAVLPPEGPQLQINGREVQEDQRSVASVRSSHVSSASSAARRAEAAAQTRLLEAELKHRQQQRQLEEQERKLRQQREDAELEFKLSQAKIRQEEMESEHGNSRPASKANSVISQPPPRKKPSQLDPMAPAWADWRRPTTEQGLLQQILLPQSTIPTFEGDPLEFMWFIKAFEVRVESITMDPTRRLHLLLQHLKGDARTLVLGCQLVDNAAEGYDRAKAKLVAKYGNKVRQALAFKSKLLEWPNLRKDSATDLEKFSVQLQLCKEVQLTGGLAELDAAGTLLQLMRKLPHKTQEAWQSRVCKIETTQLREANFDDFTTFVEQLAAARNHPVYGHKGTSSSTDPLKTTKAAVLATSGEEVVKSPTDVGSTMTITASQSTTTTTTTTALDAFKAPCLLCSGAHSTRKCTNSSKIVMADRRNRLKGLCFACLRPGHTARQCNQKATCERCKGAHPTIMHEDKMDTRTLNPATPAHDVGPSPEVPSSEKASKSSISQESGNPETACAVALSKGVAVAVVPIRVWCGPRSKAVVVRAILDPGSTASFMTLALMRKLHVSHDARSSTVQLTTMANEKKTMETRVVQGIKVASLDGNTVVTLPAVYSAQSMPFTTGDVADARDVEKWQHLQEVPFEWRPDTQVEMLIGMNAPAALRPLEVISGGADEPYAVRTALGWCVNGPLRRTPGMTATVAQATMNRIGVNEIQKGLHTLYHTDFHDAYNFATKGPSQEDREWLQRAANSIVKAADSTCGQYQLELPFRKEAPELKNNYTQAAHRLQALRRRFARDPKFKADYTAFMNKMHTEGYVEEVPELGTQTQVINYVPHHGVYHPRKPGKIRVVFNCSSRFEGVSLNDCLIPGPDLTSSLLGVLLRFRQEPIAIIADIESMFYRVRVPEHQRDALRYLWWPEGDTDQPPRVYRMAVHLFGAASSPSCANYVLRTAADDAVRDGITGVTDEVCEAVKRNFYVDDCLKSMPNEDAAIRMAHGLRAACSFGGFRLTKFMSTSVKVLQALPADELSKDLAEVDLRDDKVNPLGVSATQRALGVTWNVVEDAFKVAVAVGDITFQQTKRGMLSLLSSVYDPLGVVAPVLIVARISFRDLTKKVELGWDDELDSTQCHQWTRWLNALPMLEQIKIPRCFKDSGDEMEWQLHVFCDASEEAYATVAYLRHPGVINNVKFVMGKARVSPPKVVTIPRLELTAAKLATDVANTIQRELQLKITHRFFWSDSQTVLKYLTNRVRRFHTFVANRVHAILNSSQADEWHYVPSDLNPADSGSRGLEASAMKESMWLQGPPFLHLDSTSWPKHPLEFESLTEQDAEVHTLAVKTPCTEEPFVETLAKRYSSAPRFRAAVATWLCFMEYLKDKMSPSRQPIRKPSEVWDEVESAVIRGIQKARWSTELQMLRDDRGISKASSIYKLAPELSPSGIIQMRSRTRTRLPIIPGDTMTANLLVLEAHELQGHLGRQATAAKVAQSYWIVGLNKLVRTIVKKCPTCQRQKATPKPTTMAELPTMRLQAQHAFETTGVDYFGPFFVSRGRAKVKVYGVVFTCAVMRAVHLEVAEDLSSSSFINALRRFIARRGHVKRIVSDNGTNFVGAHNNLSEELHEELQQQNQTQLHHWLRARSIEWCFNPPAASHHGGFWERLIRIVRQIFSTMLPNWRPLTYEGMCTLMCEVEVILNNRPLTAVSEDPQDFEALTPNHLLLGREGPQPPPGDFESEVYPVRFQWKRIQNAADHFWRRWTLEYRTLLHRRAKWHQAGPRPLQVEDVVLILDPLQPREYWALGRIQHIRPNSDGVARVATIRTAAGHVERPITKLCLLEATTDYWKSS